MKKTYLMLFSISPVQAYIEQARKTQDLYAGSFILSHLCQIAIKESKISEEQLIFPKFDQNEPPQSLSNRFLACVERDIPEGQDEADILKAYGHSIQSAVKKTFKAIAESAMLDSSVNYREQVANYLTIHWAFLPFEEGQYAKTYEELEQLLGAIKHVRAFAQLPETGRKCAICGERNVKFYRKNENDDRIEKGTQSNILKQRKLFTNDVHVVGYKHNREFSPKILQPGEGLCAVCFMKRGAETYFAALPEENRVEYNPDFPSTPDIALLDALYDAHVDRSVWQGKKYEGHVIFDLQEQNEDAVRKKYADELSDNVLENSIAIANELDTEKVQPSPYYALLCFDGDSMGKWLSGVYLKDSQRKNLKDFHQALSAKLMGFAKQVRKYFKDHPHYGHVIYTGGDDFLGFVSLNSLLTVMRHLRAEFDKLDVSDFAEPDKKLTFSAGAVIAHITTPLSEVVKWARDMEKAAKKIDDNKDAFALAVLKRSGEIQQTVFKWREGETWIPDVFDEIIKQIRNEKFSGTFLQNLDKEFRRLLDHRDNWKPDHINVNHFDTEARRLITRSYQGPADAKKETVVTMEHMLNQLRVGSKRSVENLLFAFGIIDFLTRKGAICKSSK
ncbi:CRISPR-associated protein, Crm2 family [Candidatus Vecturithrix granuli]|uniref:CRISPR-associated protein, Crm2 family n=1 Tax=Vecturithrix granuli TaxID=1499967 RepID=A0A081CAK5_VECG1|nr:CRISPR-associated protein, Crm2 family [Candidatus Vecturithrix granuli]